jgi:p-hydroxybenzoate 3-monooxygenase
MATRIVTPMAVGPVYLAGDAAHTLPPAGGKGMNLAVADAVELACAITSAVRDCDDRRLRCYSNKRLPDVWRTVAFVDWLLHLLGAVGDGFDGRLGHARLTELRDSPALASWFARAYAGH